MTKTLAEWTAGPMTPWPPETAANKHSPESHEEGKKDKLEEYPPTKAKIPKECKTARIFALVMNEILRLPRLKGLEGELKLRVRLG